MSTPLQFDKVVTLTPDGQLLQRRLDISFDKISDFSKVYTTLIYRDTAQAIADTSLTLITYNAVRVDTFGSFSLSSPTQLLVKKSGLYLITHSVPFASNATGNIRFTRMLLNGSIDISRCVSPPINGGLETILSNSFLYPLMSGDLLNTAVYQDSGGTLNISANPLSYSTLSFFRLSD